LLNIDFFNITNTIRPPFLFVLMAVTTPVQQPNKI